jgi:biopolymer transport protein ExbD
MAAQLEHGDSGDLPINHDINVTPFIDVILVLLIIFMVAAPLATVQVPVELPASTATPIPAADKPVFISVQADKSLSLGDDLVPQGGLATALKAATQGDTEQRIFLRADKAIDYGTLMDVMNQMRAAGYLKVALVGLDSVPPTQSATP